MYVSVAFNCPSNKPWGTSSEQDRQDDLRLPPVQTEAGRRRCLYRGQYNGLPVEMRPMTIASFNHALKRVIATRDE